MLIETKNKNFLIINSIISIVVAMFMFQVSGLKVIARHLIGAILLVNQ